LPAPAVTPNAFAQPGPHRSRLTARSGRRVHIVLAAAPRDEMDDVREQLDYYGKQARDWTPYRPESTEPLAEHAQAVAAGRVMGSEVTGIDSLPAKLERADQNNEIVVLLLDPWTTHLAGHRLVLSEADRAGLSFTTAVLVPSSAADPETVHNRDQLRFDVQQSLPHHVAKPEALFRLEIPTAEAFDVDLADMLEEARNRTFRTDRARHATPGAATGDRPILEGP